MAYVYLPFVAHLCTQLTLGMHVPFQPNTAQNRFFAIVGWCDVPKLDELAYQPKMEENSFMA